jgi:hypothetical protein
MSAKLERPLVRLCDVVMLLGLPAAEVGDAARELGIRFAVEGGRVYVGQTDLAMLHFWAREIHPTRPRRAQ